LNLGYRQGCGNLAQHRMAKPGDLENCHGTKLTHDFSMATNLRDRGGYLDKADLRSLYSSIG
jgi:hypothetical protein